MPRALFILDEKAFPRIYGPKERAAVEELVEVIGPPLTKEDLSQSARLLDKVEIILSGWGAPLMDDAFLRTVPRLKAVFYGAGSVRYFVTEAFWERGIVLTNAYAANAIPVSEFAAAAVFLSLKHAWRHMMARKGLCQPPPEDHSPGAYQSTVGLVSLGMIGRLVRDRLLSRDLEVLVYDPFLSEEEARRIQVEKVSLEELFSRSDVISAHTPLLDITRHMLRGRHFELMKPWATFINTARGALVHEEEMIEVLRQRPDLQAVLDVTWPEPPAPDSPLHFLPNVVMTPHIAGSLNRECRRMGQYMVEELKCYLSGEPMRWRLTREKAAAMA